MNEIDFFREELENRSFFYDEDCYINAKTSQSARLSVSIAIECINRIIRGEWTTAFGVCRPPGHHSGISTPIAGFCFYNNIALVSRYL